MVSLSKNTEEKDKKNTEATADIFALHANAVRMFFFIFYQ